MKSRIIEISRHLEIPFEKRGIIVVKFEKDKPILVVATTGVVNGHQFEGIVLFTALNESDMYRTILLNQSEFELFRDELKIKNDFKPI